MNISLGLLVDYTHMPKAVNNNASRRATTTTLLIAMLHMFVTRYRPNFRGDGITSHHFIYVFVGTSVVTSTVATTDATTTESTSDAGIEVVASAEQQHQQ